MTELRDLVERYMQVRHAMGYKIVDVELKLGHYCRFLDQNHYAGQTLQNTLEWAVSGDPSPRVQSRRASAVRGFAHWARGFDPAIEIIPEEVLPNVNSRAIPYIFTAEQVNALMGRAALLPQPFRASTYWAVLGLLACTGMRVGEAIRLNRNDVADGLIRIVESKFGKSRFIPIDSSTVGVLEDYGRLRDKRFPKEATEALFVSLRGTRLLYPGLFQSVRVLFKEAGIGATSAHHPRMMDLRHTFATNTIRDSYLSGSNTAQIMPILATYLGHAHIKGTYWYLEAEPGLLNAAADLVPPLLKPLGGTP